MTGSGGFMHMLPAELEHAAHRLRMRAEELSDGWVRHESAIAGRENAIGNDVVGAAFRGVYDQELTAVKGAARTVIALLRKDADAGTTSAALYTGADVRSRDAFDRMQSQGRT